MTDRLKNNECLKCGTPLIRTDGMPLCSKCEQLTREKYWAFRNGNEKPKYKKVMKFNVMGTRMGFEKAKRVLTKP